MAKAIKQVRGKFSDEKYLGSEPDLRGDVNNVAILHAYNWYNYFYNSENSKEFLLTYLKEIKHDKKEQKLLKQVSHQEFHTLGWNARILSLGGNLPKEIIDNMFKKITALTSSLIEEEDAVEVKPVVVISIQERVAAKTSEYIGEIEGEIDTFILEGKNSFKMDAWLRSNDIKGQISQKIADYYKPLYAELFDAYNGKSEDLKEGYSHLKKPRLKAYMEFVRDIIGACELRQETVKAIRKPRKTKAKSPAQIVAKLKYKEKDEAFKIVSVRATDIIGANQLWVFNTKNKALIMYNAMGPAGLNIKGSSVTGFDEKTSMSKTLRKPENHLPKVVDGGKVVLRRLLEGIKSKSKPANGRINAEMVLVRIIK